VPWIGLPPQAAERGKKSLKRKKKNPEGLGGKYSEGSAEEKRMQEKIQRGNRGKKSIKPGEINGDVGKTRKTGFSKEKKSLGVSQREDGSVWHHSTIEELEKRTTSKESLCLGARA